MILIKPSRYALFVERSVLFLLLVYPTLMLTVKGGMNGVFILTLLLSIGVLLFKPDGIPAIVWKREWRIYFAAMIAMSFAIVLSQIFNQDFRGHPLDAASRYWLAIPIFLLLHRLPYKIFSILQFAFPIAAITGGLLIQHIDNGRYGIHTLDLIHFGDFELILGVLSILSINWFGRDKLPLRILKILGFIVGLSVSLASGSRGGWLAIPVFIGLYIYFSAPKISFKIILGSVLSFLLVISIVFVSSMTVRQRIIELKNEVIAIDKGNSDTSTGIRWQLYKAALITFVNNPIVGVGPEGFAGEMKPMMDAGKISAKAAELGRGEVHNDILSKAAGMGILGLISILVVYLAPALLFWKATKIATHQVRHSGILGIFFVSGFFVFGLTVEFLNLNMAVAFYSFTVAVLLASCYNIHQLQENVTD